MLKFLKRMLKNVKGKMANWVLLIRVFIPDLIFLI